MKATGLIATLLVTGLVGCALPGQRAGGELSVGSVEHAPEPKFTIAAITPQLVTDLATRKDERARHNAALDAAIKSYEYRVGPQDVLTFIVWDHPELTIPAGEYRSPEASGHKVGNDGMLFFPYIGEVSVVGKTQREVRVDLTQRLERYIARPQLDVRIAAFRSQKVLVSGEVKEPGILPVTDVPLTLSDAISRTGGASPTADLRTVVLIRDGQPRVFDLQALLDGGDLSQNELLKDGDVVTVPDSTLNKVHVLGEVRKPGSWPMYKGSMSLADAIGASDSFDSNTADPGRVFVIRGAPDQPLVFWLDARSPEAMLLATRFPLQPQDIVYVSHTTLAGWNRVMSQLLPTITALYQATLLHREFK